MKSIILIIALIIAGLVVLNACQGAQRSTTDSAIPNVASEIRQMSPPEAGPEVAKAYSQFVDVRTPEEYSGGHAARSVNIPLDTLSANLDRLEKSEPVYLICQTGNRSKKAAVILKDAGFNNVINVTGGTAAWQAANLPMETKAPHGAPNN